MKIAGMFTKSGGVPGGPAIGLLNTLLEPLIVIPYKPL